jgi:Lrp/AsnC family transcriptional regulator for asnA, asnC and gidA
MNKKDLLNTHLIRLLEQDGRQSSRILAKHLNASPATIRRRIKKLVDENVIRIQAVVNPSKVEIGLSAVVALDVEPSNLETAVGQLANNDNVEWLSTTTGRFDIIAELRFTSTDELYAFLQRELPRIEGLKNSETFICLHLVKAPYIMKK